MKKLLSVLLCLACVFSLLCFGACDASVEQTTSADVTDEATSDNGTENTDVVITLSADITEAAPGEEVIVTCIVKESQLFAAGDLTFAFDKEQLIVDFVGETVSSMYYFENEVESGYQYSAYVASTVDLENAVFFNAYCVLDENCRSGDEIEITLSCDEWLVGTDETGDNTKSIKDKVATNSLLIKVK